MIDISKAVTKIEEKKQIKKEKLLNSAYKLFIDKGIVDTSISDIVNDAGVAKGTFYLYFKDKWDIKEILIVTISRKLFNEAIEKMNTLNLTTFPDKIIFILDYIIDKLNNNKHLLKLFDKNLSSGLYGKDINELINKEYSDIKTIFIEETLKYNNKIKNPDVILYMIIELAGSTGYSSIINNIPLSIKEYKPFLYEQIRKMLN